MEALGSTGCVPISHCSRDMSIVLPLLAVAILLEVCLILVLSEVWCPRRSVPTGEVRLCIYFFQVRV